jgi:hypothetical protein
LFVKSEQPIAGYDWGGLGVDDQFELACLASPASPRRFGTEDATGINADLTNHIRDVASLGHQPAGRGEIAVRANSRKRETCRNGHKLLAPVHEERVADNGHGRYPAFQMGEPRQMFQEILWLIAELRPQPPPAPA